MPPPRKKPSAPTPAPPRRPDRDHVRRLVETIARQGAWDWDPITRIGTGRPTPAYDELADLVSVQGVPTMLLYGFRLGNLPTDNPDRLVDLLLAEFDENAAWIAQAV